MNWLRIGAILMALGVAAGAFGAHGLEDRVSERMLEVWQTAARYHLIHGLALVGLGLWTGSSPATGWLFLVGVLLFSGSLYAMALTGITRLGMITPLGGLCFIVGWVLWAVRAA